MGETVVTGDVIRLATSSDAPITAGTGIKAVATSGDSIDAIGVASAGGNSGDSIDVVLFGVEDITFPVAPTTAQIGKTFYLSASTSGQVTFTPPSSSGESVVKVGKVLSADGSTLTQPCKIDIDLIVEIS